MISDILEMGNKVLGMMDFSRKALDHPGDDLVAQARALDKEINALDFGAILIALATPRWPGRWRWSR